jgi:hypothetical protein
LTVTKPPVKVVGIVRHNAFAEVLGLVNLRGDVDLTVLLLATETIEDTHG